MRCDDCGADISETVTHNGTVLTREHDCPERQPFDRTIHPDGSRTCRTCGGFKSAEQFPGQGPRKYPARECYLCKRVRDRATYARKNPDGKRPKRKSRTEDGLTFWCPRCSQYLPCNAFHQGGRMPHGIASACISCRSAQRKGAYAKKRGDEYRPRGSQEPRPPRPPRPTSHRVPGSSLGAYPAVKRDVPVVDPAKCLYPASPCDAAHGYALALHLQESGVFAPFVRGWFASVGDQREGPVQPRFETERTARLWTEMYDKRVGVR